MATPKVNDINDAAIQADPIAQAFYGILLAGMPAQESAKINGWDFQTVMAWYKNRYLSHTLGLETPNDKDYEDFLNSINIQGNPSKWERLARDEIFRKILRDMDDAKIDANPLIEVVTTVSREERENFLKNNNKFLDTMRAFTHETDITFDLAIQKIEERLGEEEHTSTPQRQIELKKRLGGLVENTKMLEKIAENEDLADVVEALATENAGADFLVEVLGDREREKLSHTPPGFGQSSAVQNLQDKFSQGMVHSTAFTNKTAARYFTPLVMSPSTPNQDLGNLQTNSVANLPNHSTSIQISQATGQPIQGIAQVKAIDQSQNNPATNSVLAIQNKLQPYAVLPQTYLQILAAHQANPLITTAINPVLANSSTSLQNLSTTNPQIGQNPSTSNPQNVQNLQGMQNLLPGGTLYNTQNPVGSLSNAQNQGSSIIISSQGLANRQTHPNVQNQQYVAFLNQNNPASQPSPMGQNVQIPSGCINYPAAQNQYGQNFSHQQNNSAGHMQSSSFFNTTGMRTKDLTDYIPKFSGKNITVSEFAQACRTAWGAAPPGSEPEFMKMLSLKLFGEAAKVAMGRDFTDLEQFLGLMTRMFDKNKPYCIAVGDLPKTKQRPLETVVEYSNRIKDVGRTILMAAKRENRGEGNAKLRGDLFLFFIKNLKDEIRTRMRYNGNDFDEAVDKAREIEIELDALREEQGDESNRILFTTESEIMPSSQILLANEKPPRTDVVTCQFCSKPGHDASKCFSIIGRPGRGRQPRYAGQQYPFGQQNHLHTPFQQQFSPQFQPQSQQFQPRPFRPMQLPRCYGCQEIGHIRRQCPLEHRMQANSSNYQQQLTMRQPPPNVLHQASFMSQVPSGMTMQKNDQGTSA